MTPILINLQSSFAKNNIFIIEIPLPVFFLFFEGEMGVGGGCVVKTRATE